MINTWFKFEAKIQNASQGITQSTDDDDGTKNNMSPPGRGGNIILSKILVE